MKLRLFVGLLLAQLSLSSGATPFLFTVDNVSDELAHIDAATGATTIIGALGMDAADIDLARTDDGRLWGLNSVFQSSVELWEINPSTGAVISAVSVLGVTGGRILSAEGLGSIGNSLTIGFSPAGNSNADTFADLSMGGLITNPQTTNFDIDGLSVGSGPVLQYAVDRTPGVSSLLFELNPPLGVQFGPAFDPNLFVFNDLMPDAQSLFVIDNGTPVLHQMDLTTGLLQQTINLSRSGTYLGLANADPLPTAAPEPSTLALLGLGLLGAGYARKRRA